MRTEVVVMSDYAPRINVQTCLAELHRALTALGVTVVALHDEDGRACLEVYDHANRPRRVHVLAQFYWFCWGDDVDERTSIFHIPEAARLLAGKAEQGWPSGAGAAGGGELSRALARYLR